jgi:integrase
VACGFRISELLSLKVGDVRQHGRLVDRVTVARRFMKGGKAQTPKERPADHPEGCRCTACRPPVRAPRAQGRTVRLPPQARAALSVWLDGLARQLGLAAAKELKAACPVFCSRVHQPDGSLHPIARETAWRVLNTVFEALELQGQLGTHCLRKTFANAVYEANHHDLPKTQQALGHRNINSTVAYLSFREEDVELAILAAASRVLAA